MVSFIRMVFCDIDDTLLLPGEALEPETIQWFHRLEQNGIPLIFTTGRPPQRILPLQELTGLTAYPYIACNGGLVVCGEEIWSLDPLPIEEIDHWLETSFPEGMTVLYTIGRDEFCWKETEGSREKRRCRGDYHPVRRLDLARDAARVLKINLLNDALSGEVLDLIEENLRRCSGVAVTRYANRGFELTAAATSKAKGMQIVLNRFGCTPAQALAIGDNWNDLQMLQQAGYRATVTNALPEIRERVDFTSNLPSQAGVREILQHFWERMEKR